MVRQNLTLPIYGFNLQNNKTGFIPGSDSLKKDLIFFCNFHVQYCTYANVLQKLATNIFFYMSFRNKADRIRIFSLEETNI